MLNHGRCVLFFFLFYTILTPCPSFSQAAKAASRSFQELADARRLLAEADTLSYSGDYRQALLPAKKAKELFEKNGEWENYIRCCLLIARSYDYTENLPKSELFLEDARRTALKYLGKDHELVGKTFQHKGELFIQQSELDSAMKYFNGAIAILSNTSQYHDLTWSTLLAGLVSYYQSRPDRMEYFLNAAEDIIRTHSISDIDLNETLFQYKTILYSRIGEFEKGLKVAEEALAFRLNKQPLNRLDSNYLSINYSLLGSAYLDRGDFEKAESYYQLTIALQEILGEDPVTIATNYSNLGVTYNHQLNYKRALANFKKAVSLLKDIQKAMAGKVKYTALINAARIYVKLEQFDTARTYLNAADYFQSKQDLQLNKDFYYQSAAIIESKTGEPDKALQLLDLAIRESKRSAGYLNPASKYAYLYKGDILCEQGKIKPALQAYQSGLWPEGQEVTGLTQNPPLQQITNGVLCLPLLLSKSKALEKLPGPEKLRAAFASIDLAVELIDKMRQEYETEESRQVLSTKAFSVYEQAIKLAMKLYEQSSNSDYLHKAFFYSEKSKALVLLEALVTRAEVKQQTAVFSLPDSLIEEEKKIKTQLIFYERKIYEEQFLKEKVDSLKLNNWTRTLANIRSRYEQLRYSIRKKYPDYFNLKYDLQLATPADIRERVLSDEDRESTAFVEYFLGQDHLYTFLITRTDFKLFRQRIDSNWLAAIENLLSFQNSSPVKQLTEIEAERNFGRFAESAVLSYQVLLEKVVPPGTSQLIIIPGGMLGYLSFDLLLTQLPDRSVPDYSSRHLQYLLEDYQLTYAYSGSLLLESLDLKPNSAPYFYGGFAPFNDHSGSIAPERNCSNGRLSQLVASGKSVERVQQLLGGHKYLGKQTTLEGFIQRVPDYQLLHLSTHACVDDNDPLFNRIFFADAALSTYELYKLKLNAELVVLSACETGTGRLVQGEGIMSLARGFMKSGCPSIVTSLWNANDFSTTEIMVDFFKLLGEEQSKDEALRNAKLRYLSEAPPRLSHPYYWATFIHIGDSAPVSLPTSRWKWLLALLLLLLSFPLLKGYRMFRSRRRST